jgi:predicted nucleic acid-binding protein
VTRYLVDTNVPSELTKPAPDSGVVEFLVQAGKANVFASVVSVGEICKGIAGLPESTRRQDLRNWLEKVMRPWFAGRLLPVTEEVAERWGTITGEQRLRGRQISMADGLIAATAMEHGLTLATRNVKDFENLGIAVFNPWTD